MHTVNNSRELHLHSLSLSLAVSSIATFSSSLFAVSVLRSIHRNTLVAHLYIQSLKMNLAGFTIATSLACGVGCYTVFNSVVVVVVVVGALALSVFKIADRGCVCVSVCVPCVCRLGCAAQTNTPTHTPPIGCVPSVCIIDTGEKRRIIIRIGLFHRALRSALGFFTNLGLGLWRQNGYIHFYSNSNHRTIRGVRSLGVFNSVYNFGVQLVTYFVPSRKFMQKTTLDDCSVFGSTTDRKRKFNSDLVVFRL